MYCPVCHSDYPGDWKVCPKDATNLLTSPLLGKYRIDGLLGVGGMGAVYRATNPHTAAEVAVKVMNPSVAAIEMARSRFQREAAAVSKLTTKHVCQVFDFGEEADGTLYLVMELMRGHALRDEVRPAPEQMELARVQLVMDGALRGLIAAHKAGIVHRDLKPENIFVADTDDGEVPKLLDFGIARVRTPEGDLTGTGMMMGTAMYMAPEQVGGDKAEIGPWTDVYAMGAILYELLSGNAAMTGDTLPDVLARVLSSTVPPLQRVRPGLPPAIYELVARCMSGDHTRRPRDGEELRAAFTAAQLVPPGTPVPPARIAKKAIGTAKTSGLGSTTPSAPGTSPTVPASAPPPGKPVTEPPAPPPTKKSSPLPLVIAGLAIIGLGAVVAIKLTGGGSSKPPVDAAVIAIAPPPPVDAASLPDAPAQPPLAMVAIAGGKLTVGEPNAKGNALSERSVVVAPFSIGARELTRGELEKALGSAPVEGKDDPPSRPARFVDWATADRACKALHLRLPTELEWEAAALSTPNDPARARLLRKNTLDDLAAPATDCSPADLCDMLGGLHEWTADDFPGKPGMKVVRGASYRIAPGKAASIHLRAAFDASRGDNSLGFRCVTENP